jgi:hypothetical protein
MKTCFLIKYIFFILHVRIYMIIFLTKYIYFLNIIFLRTTTKNNFQNLLFLIIIMKITIIPNTS